MAATLIVTLGLVTSLPRALFMMQAGSVPPETFANVGALQYVREGALLVLAAVAVNHMILIRRRAGRRALQFSPLAVFIGVLVLVALVRSALAGISFEVISYGVRILVFPLLYIALRWLDGGIASSLLQRISRYAKPLIVVEALLAAYQVATAAGLYGTTFLGPRPWGTMPTPNSLAAAMVAFALLYTVARPKRWALWMTLCLAVAFITGSRTGTLGTLLIIGALVAYRIPYRALLLPFGAGIVVVALYVLSSASFSGREIRGEGRFDQWLLILSGVPLDDWFFGLGIGMGSNATLSLYGRDHVAGTVADSQLLSTYLSFGVVGVVIILWAVVAIIRKTPLRAAYLLVPTTILLGAVYNIGEVAPANLVLTVVAACAAQRHSTSAGSAGEQTVDPELSHRSPARSGPARRSAQGLAR
ncbi:O-antigen ligase family protein [Microbacterium sp. LMI1x-1-1.1]|uniref:O-antigen ligase family protein n=1 Tax=Microbacterium sp. LMI1x-1-1.1 TaxID=3135246 RepID=UPI0034147D98